jgi:hypothetical protein
VKRIIAAFLAALIAAQPYLVNARDIAKALDAPEPLPVLPVILVDRSILPIPITPDFARAMARDAQAFADAEAQRFAQLEAMQRAQAQEQAQAQARAQAKEQEAALARALHSGQWFAQAPSVVEQATAPGIFAAPTPAAAANAANVTGDVAKTAPTTSLATPVCAGACSAPASVALSATATVPAGQTVSKIEFLRGGAVIATFNTPTTTVTYTDPAVAAGAASYTVKAYDSTTPTALSTTTAAQTVTVVPPPTVLLEGLCTAPCTPGVASIALTANPSTTAAGRTISKVEFYREAETTPFATLTASPWIANDTLRNAGSYSYTAKAYDNGTTPATKVSSISNVNVGTNYALASNTAVATASSELSTSYPATAANNGNRPGTGWGTATGGWSDANSGVFPDWLQVTFPAARSIAEIDVFSAQDNTAAPVNPTYATTVSVNGLTSFDVQYWNGTAWVTVPGGAITGNTKAWARVRFAPITTDRIRVQVNAAQGNTYSRITEVEAWGVILPASTVASVVAPSPSIYGATRTITTTVTPTTATGTVSFFEGATALCSNVALTTVAPKTAACTIAANSTAGTAGAHTYTTLYSGDGALAGQSGNVAHTVNQATSATTVVSSAATVNTGQPITLTATVTPNTTTGNVEFKDGTTVLCASQALTGTTTKTATCTFNTSTTGVRTLSAKYLGDTNHAATVTAGTTSVTVNALPASTTSLIASSTTPVAGTNVTLTATVSPNTATTGTVTFKDGATTVCNAVALVGTTAKTAACTVTAITSGAHSYIATYSGDSGLAPSSNTALAVTASAVVTATTVVSSVSTVNTGLPITLTATVTPSGATGNVEFKEGATVLCAAQALTGTATKTAACTFNSSTTGVRTYTARYLGDTIYAATVTGGTTTVTVNALPVSTTALTATNTAPTTGSNITLNATLTFPGTVTAASVTGTYTFRDGATVICNAVALVTGTATTKTASCPVTAITAGAHSYTATYSGFSGLAGSVNSPALAVTAGAAAQATTTTVTFSPAAPKWNDTITLTATVTPNTATGNVNFKEGATAKCSNVALANVGGNQQASCVIPAGASVGAHTYTADYLGVTGFTASTGNSAAITVGKATPVVAITSNPTALVAGTAATLSITVTPTDATGTVNVTENSVVVGNCSNLTLPTVAPKTVSCTFVPTGGAHSYVAAFGGDTNYLTANATLASNVADEDEDIMPIIVAALRPKCTSLVPTPSATIDAGNSVTLTLNCTFPGNLAKDYTWAGPGIATTGTGNGNVSTTVNTNLFTPTIPTNNSETYTYSAIANNGEIPGAKLTTTVTVNKLITTLGLTNSVNPQINQSVTLYATVSPTPNGGTVTFASGTSAEINACGSKPVVGNSASCTVAFTTVGVRNFTAAYSGFNQYASVPSTNGSIDVKNNQPPSVAVTAAAPAGVTAGAAVPMTVQVTDDKAGSRVDYFIGSSATAQTSCTSLAATGGVCALSWTAPAATTDAQAYVIRAVVTDSDGAKTEVSNTVAVVTTPNAEVVDYDATNPTSTVGTTAGTFGAGEGGNASYSIPIQVPPGVNGVQPNLALTYSSQGGDGFLGVGWSISGLSAIARCTKTYAQDSVKEGINYDAANNDAYCLDGQRLIPIGANATADPRQYEVEYRTEIDSYSRIVSIPDTALNYSSPLSWVVYTKGGQIMSFGSQQQIVSYGYNQVSTRTNSVKYWPLDMVQDRYGNNMIVAYSTSNSRAPIQGTPLTNSVTGEALSSFAYTEIWPARIVWFNSAAAPLGEVTFVEETRLTGSINSPTTQETFFDSGAGESRLTRRLARVVVKAARDSSASPTNIFQDVRTYQLGYNTNPATSRIVLSAVRECVGNVLISSGVYAQNSAAALATADPNCLAATTFGWTQSNNAFVPGHVLSPNGGDLKTSRATDINGDGISDVLTYTGTQSTQGSYICGENLDQTCYYTTLTGTSWSQCLSSVLSNGTYTHACTALTLPVAMAVDLTRPNAYNVADVDGDGYADLTIERDVGGVRTIYVCRGGPNGITGGTNPALCSAFNVTSADNSIQGQFADINGDGRQDYVILGGNSSGPSKITVCLQNNTGTAFNCTDPVISPLPGSSATGALNKTFAQRHSLLADINGDGKVDIIHRPTGQDSSDKWQVVFSDSGATNVSLINSAQSVTAIKGEVSKLHILDFNGDGLADMASLVAGSAWRVCLSSGDGSFQFTAAGATWSSAGYWVLGTRVVTVNGSSVTVEARYSPVDNNVEVDNIAYDVNNPATYPYIKSPTVPRCRNWSGLDLPSERVVWGDFNGDGRSDMAGVVFNGSIYVLKVCLSTGTGFNCSVWDTGGVSLAAVATGRADENLLAADFNGDGKTDIAVKVNSTWQVLFSGSQAPLPADSIVSITTGFGATTAITYAAMTAGDSVYVKPLSTDPLSSYQSGAALATNAEIDIKSPMYLVQRVDADNGIGGVYSTTYSYGGAKAHAKGRGMLGFAKRTVVESQPIAAITTVTETTLLSASDWQRAGRLTW